jgi:hypothetical protein
MVVQEQSVEKTIQEDHYYSLAWHIINAMFVYLSELGTPQFRVDGVNGAAKHSREQ